VRIICRPLRLILQLVAGAGCPNIVGDRVLNGQICADQPARLRTLRQRTPAINSTSATQEPRHARRPTTICTARLKPLDD